MAQAAKLLGDEWTLLILRDATYGVTRFDDLKNDLGISSATLAQRLKRLLDAGVLMTVPYQDGGARPRKEYRLTARGLALAPVMLAMLQWADEHLDKDPSPVDIVDARSGEALTLALVDPQHQVVPWTAAQLKVR